MARPFRFGLVSVGNVQSAREWIDLARKTEDLGYATLLVVDRTQTRLAPLSALGLVAGVTSSLRIGSHVFCNDFRHPAMLAKEAATLDLLSNGRFELGIGAGAGPWDYQQLGLDFASPGTRVGRVEEALQIIKQHFHEGKVEFSGQHYQVTGLPSVPKVVQRPHPPIFIGSASKRMLSIAAREADIVSPTVRPGPPDPNEVPLEEKIGWVRQAAGERFSLLELAQGAYDLAITDSTTEVQPSVGGPPVQLKAMTTTQAVEYLLERRERYGFSYIQLHDGQFENFAPVVARLAGQ